MKLCCLLLLGITLCVRAESPGRLFFSPEERRRLEQPSPPPAAPRIDGILVSSSGLYLRWVNNRIEPGATSASSVGGPAMENLRSSGRVSVVTEQR